MALISIPFTFTVGAVIVASQHNSNFSTIYNDYNGNITTSNIAANAAIADTQLAQISSASKISGAALTLLTSVPSGAGLLPVANSQGINAIGAYVKVSNTQTSGTGGGNTTSGSWLTAVLNTKDNDTGSIASLASNLVTLPAGTYKVNGHLPFSGNSPGLQIRIWNNTDSAILVNGSNNNGDSSANVAATCFVRGQFTLSVSKDVALQYRSSTSTTNGQGVANSFGTEVYAIVEFVKVA